MKPFLKWVGGKRQILKHILPRIPEGKLRYVEPFVGGGAVFFALQKAGRLESAIINDSNWRLMATYRAVQSNVTQVIAELRKYSDSAASFIGTRVMLNGIVVPDASCGMNEYTQKNIEIAAGMIFLNRTCFNGLYRENSKGEINSPWAPPEKRSKGPLFDPEVLEAASQALRAQITVCANADFMDVLRHREAGEFCYIDPPYMPVKDTAFTAYTGNKFGFEQHEKLRDMCVSLNDRGVKFLLSNADTPRVRELYKDFKVETIEARRAVNSNGQGRGKVNEVLVSNY